MVDLHCTQLTEYLKTWFVPIWDLTTKVRQKPHQRPIRFDLNTQRHKYTKFRVLLCGYTGFGIVEFQVIVQMEGCFGFKDGPIDQMFYEPTIDHNRGSPELVQNLYLIAMRWRKRPNLEVNCQKTQKEIPWKRDAFNGGFTLYTAHWTKVRQKKH